MDIEYIITESRRMDDEKALRYLRYHGELQHQKKERLKRKIQEIENILSRIREEMHRREYQRTLVSCIPSNAMGEGEEREEEAKKRK